jgi:XTP/dITP diphosphohydrolase
MNTVIFATSNEGKMREVREMLEGTGIECISMKEAGFDGEVDETGTTFEENALIKARTVAKALNLPVLADDSGLEVDYLDKAPGIYSARFMGHDTSYTIKNQAIIDKLEGVEGNDRSARFVCAMALALPDGTEVTTRGTMEGLIAKEIKGTNGFGYDPIVYIPEFGMCSAELAPEQKNAISHRGKALRAMKDEIVKVLA